jgi:hypothetical protein
MSSLPCIRLLLSHYVLPNIHSPIIVSYFAYLDDQVFPHELAPFGIAFDIIVFGHRRTGRIHRCWCGLLVRRFLATSSSIRITSTRCGRSTLLLVFQNAQIFDILPTKDPIGMNNRIIGYSGRRHVGDWWFAADAAAAAATVAATSITEASRRPSQAPDVLQRHRGVFLVDLVHDALVANIVFGKQVDAHTCINNIIQCQPLARDVSINHDQCFCNCCCWKARKQSATGGGVVAMSHQRHQPSILLVDQGHTNRQRRTD